MATQLFSEWKPKDVSSIIYTGNTTFIGLIDDSTVLKYSRAPPEDPSLDTSEYQKRWGKTIKDNEGRFGVEVRILRRLGQHQTIVQFKGEHKHGFLLEYLRHGSVQEYLLQYPDTSVTQRLSWACQAAEGLAFAHTKDVIVCDMSVKNLLIANDLSLKICGIDGLFEDTDGTTVGGAPKGVTMSRVFEVSQEIDIHALGTAIYVISTGKVPFPDLDADQEDEIDAKFAERKYPPLETIQAGDVIRKCWGKMYPNAAGVVTDMKLLLESSTEKAATDKGKGKRGRKRKVFTEGNVEDGFNPQEAGSSAPTSKDKRARRSSV